MTKEIKIKDNIYRIIGLQREDVANITVSIVKNGITKCQHPVSLIEKLGIFWFPDNPIEYDKTKDKIEIVIKAN